MGLTTYLLQSFFAFFIFTSVGLGLLYDYGAATWFFVGVVMFGLQIAFSKLWFRYFHFGLFEWLWRSLTYLKFQPLLKQKKLAVPVSSS